MNKVILLILSIFCSLSLHAQTLSDKTPLTKVSIQLQWKYQFQFAGFIMAKEKGYYEELGLDVVLKEYSNTDTIEDLVSGKVDFLVNNNTLLFRDKKLLDVTLLATYFQRSPLILVTQPNIKKVLDLKGKKIMLSPDDLKYTPIARLLKHFDITTNNTSFVEQTFSIDAFINKEVDAVAIFSSNETYLLNKKSIAHNIIDPTDYGFSTNAINLFATHSTVKKHPDLVKKLLKANKKGWEYALAHIDETARLIHQKYNAKSSLDALMFEAEATKKLMMTNRYDIGAINYEFVKNSFERLTQNSEVLANENMSQVVYKHNYKVEQFLEVIQVLKIILFVVLIPLVLMLGRYTYLKQKALQLKNTLQSQIIEQVHDSIISTDLKGNILSWNEGSQKMLGYSQEEIIGQNMSLIHRPEDIDQNIEYAVRLQNESSFSVESYLLAKDKTEIYAAITLSTLKDSNGVTIGLLGVSKDISKRKEMEDTLKNQKNILDWHAHHDSLTKLPNRLLFYDRLEEGIKRNKRNNTSLALFFLDLDHFKEVNDSFGHEVGDKLLQRVSIQLKNMLREEDTLSRLGGDEFTIIINDLENLQSVSILAQKIIELLSQSIQIDEHKIAISCSLGISLYPSDTTKGDELLKYADNAMYKAKNQGKNNFKYYSEAEEFTT